MTLALVIASMGMGGAQRALQAMAGYWLSKDVKITLITLDSDAGDFYEVPGRIRRVALGAVGQSANPLTALWRNVGRIQALRRALRKANPDVVISFLDTTNVLTLLATRGLRMPVLVSERTDPRQHTLPVAWRWLRRLTYLMARGIVVQTISVQSWFAQELPRVKSWVVPNAVGLNPQPALRQAEARDNEKWCVLTVGRLTHAKGFDLLLQAFAKIVRSHPGWRLIVCGEGEERNALEALATDLKVADRVVFSGKVQDIEQRYAQADLFVLSSRYEGFPNALIEAMAFGLPVVSFDCPSGPAEIIRNGIDGVLVPAGDVDALAAAMSDLMSDPEKRRRLGQGAATITERLGLEQVMRHWDVILEEVLNQRISA